ncbi:MAG: hypothetical protein HC881_20190 [Leptolyngbyaceae cyanobacterium SL_7_1]|nr:hypothetical protein [Leptolyngbyaceae cyanobacterium SL_7_1]
MQILKAAQQLRTARHVDPDTRTKVIASLHQILYEIREHNRLDGHERTVIDVAYSPDGEWLASASDDNDVRLWKADGTPIAPLKGHTMKVRSVAFHPTGEVLASASYMVRCACGSQRASRPELSMSSPLTTAISTKLALAQTGN